jgi:ferrous iron transport protein A
MTKQQVRLGSAPLGFRGNVEAIEPRDNASGISPLELESRLIELGFIEGVSIEVLHEGLFGRDPIAIRINNMTVALRRREAMAILVRELEPSS